MKKVFSILLSLLMFSAMLHFSIATHYCQGNLAASKISLSGKLASCGMESDEANHHVPGNTITSHCCDDVVTYFGIDNDYSPTFYIPIVSYQNDFQVLAVTNELPVQSLQVLKSLYTNASPPGALRSTRVDLSDICVFRI